MRRRDALAGIASVGTLVAGPAILVGGIPSSGNEGSSSGGSDDGLPVTVETIDAGASEAGSERVPDGEHVSVINFFVTYCHYCQAQMPPLVEARERIDDDVRFLSINTEPIGDGLSEGELGEWWREYDGSWNVGYGSVGSLRREYGIVGYPVTLIIAEDGSEYWHEGVEVFSADRIVEEIEAIAGSSDR